MFVYKQIKVSGSFNISFSKDLNFEAWCHVKHGHLALFRSAIMVNRSPTFQYASIWYCRYGHMVCSKIKL